MQEDFARRVIGLGLVPQMVNRCLFTTLSDVAPDNDTQDIFEGVSKKLGILFTSRSGSTFLSHYLTETGLFGSIQEHLSAPAIQRAVEKDGVKDMRAYVRQMVARAKGDSGVFAFKGTIQSLVPLAQIGELPDNINDWCWIFIDREDTVAQAVSLFRARRTGRWHSKGTRRRKLPTPRYDFDAILRCYNHTLRMAGMIESFFSRHRIQPLRLSYEKFQSDPFGALAKSADRIGIEISQDQMTKWNNQEFKILRNAGTARYVERFRREFANRLQTVEGFK
jgi:LPS sulfotransferase NodH